jgi:hypothetical protein
VCEYHAGIGRERTREDRRAKSLGSGGDAWYIIANSFQRLVLDDQ